MKLLFSLAILANAALIFWVELLFAKKLLPTLGGAPAIWNTCLMFYQVLLLAGYAYAVGVSRLGLRRQVALHGGLMLLAVAGLPWLLFVWPDPGAHPPVFWLLALLTLSLGLPFFALAGGAPLLQRWFSLSNHPEREDPYFLYAASNVGSFLGLMAYPAVMEPFLTLEGQEASWKLSYAAVAVLVVGCGTWALLGKTGPEGGAAQSPGPGAPPPLREGPLTRARRLRWVGLAFVPSSLLLGVTTHITSEVAPVPLLWVVPLALYLLTFVLAFGPLRTEGSWEGRAKQPRRVGVWNLVLGGLAVAAVMVWLMVAGVPLPDPMWLMVLAHLAVLVAAGLVCHTRVARDRPHPRHLAEFYLWVAVGGALGGVFNALLAPVLFTDPLEYPLVLAVLAFLVASGARGRGPRLTVGDVGLGVLPGLVAFLLSGYALREGMDPVLLLLVPGILCLALAGRPARFGIGIAGLVLVGFLHPVAGGQVVFKDRTFYGIHRVYQDRQYHWLAHGTTIHGGQGTDRPEVPLTYYHPAGPAGSLFQAFDADAERRERGRVAMVGLGTGSLIAYGRAGQEWSFYELDPSVVRIAEDEELFTYLRDASAAYVHVLGDARLSLERAEGAYDLILIDAFSSDAVPVHLLTREAVELYLERLRPGGMIAFHISNRYADFSGVLADLGGELGLIAYEALDEASDRERGYYASQWAVLSPVPVTFRDPIWRELEPTGGRVWTDSYSSLFRVLRW